jgi:hypothetical protein
MKRFIDTEQSPRFQIDKTSVTQHFSKTWAKSENDVREAEQGTSFVLDPRLTERDQEEMEAFRLDNRNIEGFIMSRQDLSAGGID